MAATLLAACQQTDQGNPFQVDEDQVAQLTIGPSGGTISLPAGVSMDFPEGSLPGAVALELSRLSGASFPASAGGAVPGAAFHVGMPSGTELTTPARVQMAVDPALLDAGEQLRLAVAVHGADGSVPTFPGRYDAGNGILHAEIGVLGDLAAVVALDAVTIGSGGPPLLAGGHLPAPDAPEAPGPAVSMRDGVEFTAECGPNFRPCHTAGYLRLWADDVVRERLGEHLVLMNPTIDASVDFISFDEHGVPMEVVGSVAIDGELRARLGNVVTGHPVSTTLTTGPTAEPLPTGLEIVGNKLIVEQVELSHGGSVTDEHIEFAVGAVGTATMLQLRVRAEIDFANGDGTTTTGVVTAHLRLRR